MKKIALLAGASMFAFAGAALADSPFPEQPNPNAKSQGNCVGVFSSRVTHNGGAVSQEAQAGTRSTDVHAAQDASCPPS